MPLPIRGVTAVERFVASFDDDIETYGVLQHNQEHPSLNKNNAVFLIDEVFEVVASGAGTGLGGETLLSSRTFNYGKSTDPNIFTRSILDVDLTVQNTGKLWVNRSGEIAFTDEVDAPNDFPTHFDLFVQNSNCNTPLNLIIQNSGELYLGEWTINNNNGTNNTATVYIKENSNVLIKNNGTLRMDNNSKIIIEDGGKVKVEAGGTLQTTNPSQIIVERGGILEIDPNANIDLWWGGSTIHIKEGGELRINGDFNFSGSGYFQFDEGHILSFGPSVDVFRLSGQSLTTRFIKLNGGAVLDLGGKDLDLEYGLVEFGGGSGIQGVEGDLRLQAVTFQGSGDNSLLTASNLEDAYISFGQIQQRHQRANA